MMRSLLIIAHGSRNPESNTELSLLCQSFKQLNHGYQQVALCFLEMTPPNILQGIEKLVAMPSQKIDILPYFLSAGNHVGKDIPTIIEKIKVQYADIEFALLPHIGSHPKQAQLILQHLNYCHIQHDENV